MDICTYILLTHSKGESHIDQDSIICRGCKNNSAVVTDPEMGETVCSICGIVISEKIQERLPEWRSFSDEIRDRSRTGLPNSLARHDMGISTLIAKTNIDAHGNRLNRSTCNNMYRLREWHFRSQINSSRSVKAYHAFQELSALKDKLALSDAITEKTAYIYRKAKERGLIRGRATDGILAAGHVCRM